MTMTSSPQRPLQLLIAVMVGMIGGILVGPWIRNTINSPILLPAEQIVGQDQGPQGLQGQGQQGQGKRPAISQHKGQGSQGLQGQGQQGQGQRPPTPLDQGQGPQGLQSQGQRGQDPKTTSVTRSESRQGSGTLSEVPQSWIAMSRNGLAPSAPLLKTKDEQVKAGNVLHELMMNTTALYHCDDVRRIRNRVEGAWSFCGDIEFVPKPPCLVYSFGIAYDFTFDDAFGKMGCDVYSYDPSMNVNDHRRSPKVMFYKIGLGSLDTDWFEPRKDSYVRKKTFWKMRTFKTLLKEHGHENKTIDVVKMDIESTEWAVVRNMLDTGVLRLVKQLLLEWHIFPDFPPRDTFQQLVTVHQDLQKAGFRPFTINAHTDGTLNWARFLQQSDMGYVNTQFAKS